MTEKKMTKGERTAQRILDAAERLFAQRGFDGTSLRHVATVAEIREPGIYNHFAGKEALYCAVLERGLRPMADAMAQFQQDDLQQRAELPSIMIDLLAQHPHMPALFQQALVAQGAGNTAAQKLMTDWLQQLFSGGRNTFERQAETPAQQRSSAIRMIAMFNLCSGYFLSQRLLDQWSLGSLLDEENLAEHKRMLGKIIRLFLLE